MSLEGLKGTLLGRKRYPSGDFNFILFFWGQFSNSFSQGWVFPFKSLTMCVRNSFLSHSLFTKGIFCFALFCFYCLLIWHENGVFCFETHIWIHIWKCESRRNLSSRGSDVSEVRGEAPSVSSGALQVTRREEILLSSRPRSGLKQKKWCIQKAGKSENGASKGGRELRKGTKNILLVNRYWVPTMYPACSPQSLKWALFIRPWVSDTVDNLKWR